MFIGLLAGAGSVMVTSQVEVGPLLNTQARDGNHVNYLLLTCTPPGERTRGRRPQKLSLYGAFNSHNQ